MTFRVLQRRKSRVHNTWSWIRLLRHRYRQLFYNMYKRKETTHSTGVWLLVQRWSTISRCWPSVAPTIVRKTPMLPVLWPVANYYWPLRPANRTTALVQCRANAISSHYEQDVGPTLGQCLQLVSFIYKYVIFPVDFPDYSELSNRRRLDYSKQIKTWRQPCIVLTLPARVGWQSPNDYHHAWITRSRRLLAHYISGLFTARYNWIDQRSSLFNCGFWNSRM